MSTIKGRTLSIGWLTTTVVDDGMELERITMDFVCGLPRTQTNHDAIWVIVDSLTKSAHLLAITMDYSLEHLA